MISKYNQALSAVTRDLNDISVSIKEECLNRWETNDDAYEKDFEHMRVEEVNDIDIDWLSHTDSIELISLFYMIRRLSAQLEVFYEKEFEKKWLNSISHLSDHSIDDVLKEKRELWKQQ